MKAILVVDIGNDDIDSYEVCVRKTSRDMEVEWEKETKLKPMPQKAEYEGDRGIDIVGKVWTEGWNNCLKEIEGD